MNTQYWVIGADYRDTDFTTVIEGSLRVSGPYNDRTQANDAWRTESHAHRHMAMTRFTIASSSGGAFKS